MSAAHRRPRRVHHRKGRNMYKTREEWLHAAAAEFAEHIERETGRTVPAIRIGIGFPSAGIRSGVIGECWTPRASADGTHEIFIRADRTPAGQEQGLLDVLLHEMVHAVAGIPAGHGPEFKAIAQAVGLGGRMTATVPMPDLRDALEAWAQYGSIGRYLGGTEMKAALLAMEAAA